MTDKQDEKKTKKLTLGSSKLSLGSKSVYPKRVSKTLGGSGSVVVEVKHGKAASGGLSLNRARDASVPGHDQDNRRLAALQKSREDNQR